MYSRSWEVVRAPGQPGHNIIKLSSLTRCLGVPSPPLPPAAATAINSGGVAVGGGATDATLTLPCHPPTAHLPTTLQYMRRCGQRGWWVVWRPGTHRPPFPPTPPTAEI
ncbi:hypothetical protein Pcinc_033260 [Petrolisthes cinctipes]|uniref:Uncharacterized protein n=1 Tax=Petrolisthes cinctipes TaxID=88211 RepID=A0AAE1JZ38_PETCI|nr:hypothetical protein Pcinc_033260 [Petrolisthes cinctipes]